jgi:hypothetical protein
MISSDVRESGNVLLHESSPMRRMRTRAAGNPILFLYNKRPRYSLTESRLAGGLAKVDLGEMIFIIFIRAFGYGIVEAIRLSK